MIKLPGLAFLSVVLQAQSGFAYFVTPRGDKLEAKIIGHAYVFYLTSAAARTEAAGDEGGLASFEVRQLNHRPLPSSYVEKALRNIKKEDPVLSELVTLSRLFEAFAIGDAVFCVIFPDFLSGRSLLWGDWSDAPPIMTRGNRFRRYTMSETDREVQVLEEQVQGLQETLMASMRRNTRFAMTGSVVLVNWLMFKFIDFDVESTIQKELAQLADPNQAFQQSDSTMDRIFDALSGCKECGCSFGG